MPVVLLPADGGEDAVAAHPARVAGDAAHGRARIAMEGHGPELL